MADIPKVYAGFNNMPIIGTPITAESVQARIAANNRYGTNLIQGGERFTLNVTNQHDTPLVLPNKDTSNGKTLGYSTVPVNQVFIGGGYENERPNTIIFVVQYDRVRFYQQNGVEIHPLENTVMFRLYTQVSYMANNQYFNSNYWSDYYTGTDRWVTLFVQDNETINGAQYPITKTTEYGANAAGWFVGMGFDFENPVFANLGTVIFDRLFVSVLTLEMYNALTATLSKPIFNYSLEETLLMIQNGVQFEQLLTIEKGEPYENETPIILEAITDPTGNIVFDIKGAVRTLFINKKTINGNIILDYNLIANMLLSGSGVGDKTPLLALNAIRQVGRVADMYPFNNQILMTGKKQIDEDVTLDVIKYKGYPLEMAYLNADANEVSIGIYTEDSDLKEVTSEKHFLINVPDGTHTVKIPDSDSAYVIDRWTGIDYRFLGLVRVSFMDNPVSDEGEGFALVWTRPTYTSLSELKVFQYDAKNNIFALTPYPDVVGMQVAVLYKWVKTPAGYSMGINPNFSGAAQYNAVTELTDVGLSQYWLWGNNGQPYAAMVVWKGEVYSRSSYDLFAVLAGGESAAETRVVYSRPNGTGYLEGRPCLANNILFFCEKYDNVGIYLCYTTDGVNIQKLRFGDGGMNDQFIMTSVDYWQGIYYICDNTGNLYKSTDLITYELIRKFPSGIYGVIWDTEYYYVLGSDYFYKTNDFVTYTNITTVFSGTYYPITNKFTDGKSWVVWGESGIVAVSDGHSKGGADKKLEIVVLPGCVGDAPFYVRWINQIGGYDYYMFNRGNLLKRETDNAKAIEKYALPPDNTNTRDVYAIEASETIEVIEEVIDRKAWDLLTGIAVSNKIEYYDTERGTWLTISIVDSDNTFEQSAPTGLIHYEFVLEQTLTPF